MDSTGLRVISRGAERARTGPWRGDGQIAYLAPAGDAVPLSASFVRQCATELAHQGYSRVVTSALAAAETEGFLEAGFAVEQRLHLLSHDLRNLPEAPVAAGFVIRRPRARERQLVLDVDAEVFDSFWRLDDAGLEEAIGATPRARFRVMVGSPEEPRPVVGYAVTGRAHRRGYLQRLAVDTAHQGMGLGRALVVDGLRWLRRRMVDRVLVNTQVGNERALELYLRLGFRHEPEGLTVLALGLVG
ncbi:MAG TPA: GNAT family N-acetyltransferase [Acidimicrobiales bacterium]|nr:GNAT family N-acetyltransferase [Acidimicrobiales bacterium]